MAQPEVGLVDVIHFVDAAVQREGDPGIEPLGHGVGLRGGELPRLPPHLDTGLELVHHPAEKIQEVGQALVERHAVAGWAIILLVAHLGQLVHGVEEEAGGLWECGEMLRQQLTIELADGRALDARHRHPRRDPADPLADERLGGCPCFGRCFLQINLRGAAEEEEGAQPGRHHGIRALAQACRIRRHPSRIGQPREAGTGVDLFQRHRIHPRPRPRQVDEERVHAQRLEAGELFRRVIAMRAAPVDRVAEDGGDGLEMGCWHGDSSPRARKRE